MKMWKSQKSKIIIRKFIKYNIEQHYFGTLLLASDFF